MALVFNTQGLIPVSAVYDFLGYGANILGKAFRRRPRKAEGDFLYHTITVH